MKLLTDQYIIANDIHSLYCSYQAVQANSVECFVLNPYRPLNVVANGYEYVDIRPFHLPDVCSNRPVGVAVVTVLADGPIWLSALLAGLPSNRRFAAVDALNKAGVVFDAPPNENCDPDVCPNRSVALVIASVDWPETDAITKGLTGSVDATELDTGASFSADLSVARPTLAGFWFS